MKYTSKPITVPVPPQAVVDRFADLSAFNQRLEQLPQEQRARLTGVSFTPDSIVLQTPQVGAITLKVAERTPGRVRLDAQGSPVPLALVIDVAPEGTGSSLQAGVDVEIPAMLRPLIGGRMQEMADKFGDVLGGLVQ